MAQAYDTFKPIRHILSIYILTESSDRSERQRLNKASQINKPLSAPRDSYGDLYALNGSLMAMLDEALRPH